VEEDLFADRGKPL
jgi:hypothetical protein